MNLDRDTEKAYFDLFMATSSHGKPCLYKGRCGFHRPERGSVGKMSKRKGSSAERELAALLRDQYGFKVRRGYLMIGEPDLVGLDGIHIEAKRHERPQMSTWLQQAIIASQKYGGFPTVFSRASRQPWYVTMREADWREMGGIECEVDARYRFDFNDRMANLKSDALLWRRQEVMVSMKLEDWVGLYVSWIVPFGRSDNVSDNQEG